jgi:hypothetical protein
MSVHSAQSMVGTHVLVYFLHLVGYEKRSKRLHVCEQHSGGDGASCVGSGTTMASCGEVAKPMLSAGLHRGTAAKLISRPPPVPEVLLANTQP